jgi:hypothetical protein
MTELSVHRAPARCYTLNPGSYHVQEVPVDTRVLRELRVERRGQQVVLFHKNGKAVTFGKNANLRPDAGKTRSADEDHLQRMSAESALRVEDRAVVLPAVGVAFDGCIQNGQTGLSRVKHLAGQQNGSGAGAEGRAAGDKFLERNQKIVTFQELEKRGRLASRDYEAVDCLKLRRLAHQHQGKRRARVCRSATQRGDMGRVITLDSQHADAERAGLRRRVAFFGRLGLDGHA